MPPRDPAGPASMVPRSLPRILLLGGTGDALAIARQLREDDVYSIAGLGTAPAGLPCRVREGGFGGAPGLTQAIGDGAFGLLVDATHPYAAQISANAVAAAKACRIPYWRLERPAWVPSAMDRWIDVDDWTQTLDAIRGFRRPLWTLGREPLAHTGRVLPGQHWYVRCLPETAERHVGSRRGDGGNPRRDDGAAAAAAIEALTVGDHGDVSSGFTVIPARGPFTVATERALVASLGIDVIVSKNSGGSATDAKLQVARESGLPVIMRRRPAPAWAPLRDQTVQSPGGAVDEAFSTSAPTSGVSGVASSRAMTAPYDAAPLRMFASAAAVLAALSARSP